MSENNEQKDMAKQKEQRVLTPEMIKNNGKKPTSATVKSIQKTCVWIMFVSGDLMAFVSVLAIWFDAEYAVDKAWATFCVIGAISLFVAVIAPLLDYIEK